MVRRLRRKRLGTESDQTLFSIVARLTPVLAVVDFQIRRCSASLAAPAITLENLPADLYVHLGTQSDPRSLRPTLAS